MVFPPAHLQRVARARASLEGLSVGDAFGERFFVWPHVAEGLIAARALPGGGEWQYTDDTVMALAIVEVLEAHGGIDQDALAARFAEKYRADPRRGYGGGAHDILSALVAGEPWRDVAPRAFDGTGSMGNGGAMRAAPIGAYYAGELAQAAEAAARSAEVTHAHPEGQAGAIAVAVAAAWAASGGSAGGLFDAVLAHVPHGPTRAGIAAAAHLSSAVSVRAAVGALGSGARVLAEDTVPFVLWCAVRHYDHFEDALWNTVAGLGDRDTTCAMVGGILASRDAGASIPEAFLRAREPLAVMAHGVRG